jgi:hypothetical protein
MFIHIHTLITQLMDIIINRKFSIFAPKWSALKVPYLFIFFLLFHHYFTHTTTTRVLETQFPRNLSFS